MQPATAGLLLFPVIHAPGIPVHGRPTSYKGSKDEANPRDLLYSGRGTEACLGQVRLRGLRPCSFLPRGQGAQGSAHGGLCLQDGGPWLCQGGPPRFLHGKQKGLRPQAGCWPSPPPATGCGSFSWEPLVWASLWETPPSHTFTRHLKLSASQADLTFPKTRVLFSTGLWGAGGTLLCGPHAQ